MPALVLSGCASNDKTYPSLAVRDAERISGTLEVAPSEIEPAPLNVGVVELLPRIEAEAREAHAAFVKAETRARSTIRAGRGAGVDSDRWARAQIALADLESLRSQTAIALGDLDLLYVDATLAFEEREKVARLRDLVVGFVAAEDALLAALANPITR